jgi:hypothetical protein
MTIQKDLECVLEKFGNDKVRSKKLSYFADKRCLGDKGNDDKGVTRLENWIQLELMYEMEEILKLNDVNYEMRHTFHSGKLAQSNKAQEKKLGSIDLVFRPANNATLNRLVAVELKIKQTASRAIKAALADLVKMRRYKESDVTKNGTAYRAVYSVCIFRENNTSNYKSITDSLGASSFAFGKAHWAMVIGWEGPPTDDPKTLSKSFNHWVRENIIKPASNNGLKLTPKRTSTSQAN